MVSSIYIYLSRILMAPFLVFALCLPTFAQTPPQIEGVELSTDKLEKLHNNAIIVDIETVMDPAHGKSVAISAMMFIDASDQQIWPILTDCARAPSITPGLVKCEILDKAEDGSWDIRRHTSKIGFGLAHVVSEFRSEFDAPHSQSFQRTGGDLKALQGKWRIIPMPDSMYTLVAYDAKISSKSVIPDYVLRRSLKKRIPIVMEALRQEIIAEPKKTYLAPPQEN